MRFARTAKDLGIECVDVPLIQGGPKQWKHEATDEWSSVENAAARYFERLGWSVCASEGGLILTLIKAASFPEVKATEANVFVEAFYHQFSNGFRAYPPDWLLKNVAAATAGQIERNFTIIAAETGLTPYYFPAVCRHHVVGLYETLGNDRLLAIAKIFASAPYDFRAGWPDLTIWRDRGVAFYEVKAPGDQVQASQRRLISQILVPLGFEVGIIEVTRKDV